MNVFGVNKFILQYDLSITFYFTIGMYHNLFNQSNRKPVSFFFLIFVVSSELGFKHF